MKKQTLEAIRARAEVERLRGIINEFCHKQRHSADTWKMQSHIAALFDVAREDPTDG